MYGGCHFGAKHLNCTQLGAPSSPHSCTGAFLLETFLSVFVSTDRSHVPASYNRTSHGTAQVHICSVGGGSENIFHWCWKRVIRIIKMARHHIALEGGIAIFLMIDCCNNNSGVSGLGSGQWYKYGHLHMLLLLLPSCWTNAMWRWELERAKSFQ